MKRSLEFRAERAVRANQFQKFFALAVLTWALAMTGCIAIVVCIVVFTLRLLGVMTP